MKKELIRDNGKIRNCTSNHRKMSILEIAYNFEWYGKTWKDLVYCIGSSFKDAIPFLFNIFLLPFYILFFPVLPFIRAYFKKKAK